MENRSAAFVALRHCLYRGFVVWLARFMLAERV